MSKSIHSIIPDHEAILALEPEEVAGVVLEYLNSIDQSREGMPNRYNFSLSNTVEEYPKEVREQILEVLMEGWSWLEREGLIAPKPGQQGEWVFVTRRGRMIKTADQLKAFRRSDLLPRQLLHPIIGHKVWSNFIRGEYETAVFQAFKEVEVAVRKASGLPQTDVGVKLMRNAFGIGNAT